MVVMDAHLDAIPTSVRWKAGMALEGAEAAVAPAGEPPADLYTCGTWLTSIIDEGVISAPDVLVMGVGDYPSEPQPGEKEGLAAYREAYRSLEGRGVRVLTRRTMREEGIGTAVTRALSGVEGKPLYVSIDADFAAGERVRAVRFLDMLGLTPQEAVEAARAVGSALTGGSNRLAGVDVMEIDVHGADIPGGSDRTIPVSSEIVHALLRR